MLKRGSVVFCGALIAMSSVIVHAEEKSAREYYDEGVALMQGSKPDEAIAAFEKAKELGPQYPQIYNALGVAYLQQKYPLDDAIEVLENAIRIDPEFADAYCNLGVAYSSPDHDAAMAEEYYHKAIALVPGYARAYFGLGWIKIVRKNQPARAVQDFEKAIQTDPNYWEAHFYLGLCYILSGQKPMTLRPISYLRSKGKEDLALALEGFMEVDPESLRRTIWGSYDGKRESASTDEFLPPKTKGKQARKQAPPK